MIKKDHFKLKSLAFWLASCTWGIVMTFIGAIIALALLITGHKPQKFHYLVYFEVGKNWGGMNYGAFFFTSENPSLHVLQHESGHGLQNIMLGVFMPFLVAIPSAIRYWYREIKIRKGKGSTLKPYDSVWFEGWATALGEKHFPVATVTDDNDNNK